MERFNAAVYLVLVMATFVFLYALCHVETLEQLKPVGFYGMLIVISGYIWRWSNKTNK